MTSPGSAQAIQWSSFSPIRFAHSQRICAHPFLQGFSPRALLRTAKIFSFPLARSQTRQNLADIVALLCCKNAKDVKCRTT